MEQIFYELEQFGLKHVNSKELNIGHKYMILGFKKCQSNDLSLIKFSDKINEYINKYKTNKPKKAIKQVKKTIIEPQIKNMQITLFSYAKYLGIFKGIPKIYKHKYSNNKVLHDSDSDSDSDSEVKVTEKNSKTPQKIIVTDKLKNQYEYIEKDLYFEKNDNIIIYNHDLYGNNIELLLFEVDDSFSDANFLNLILAIMSNYKFERDRFIEVICSNKDITVELSHKNIPTGYHSSLDFDKKKKYSLDEDFIFFN